MNYSSKKELSDTKPARLKTSDLEKPQEGRTGLKDEEKFWLIQNGHLNNIIEQQCLQIDQLKEELKAALVDRKALDEIRRNNEQLQLEMENSEQKMLQLVDQNRDIASKFKRLLDKCKQLEQKASAADQLKVQLEQVKYECQMKITSMEAELDELKKQPKPVPIEDRHSTDTKTPIKGLIVRRHRIVTETAQDAEKKHLQAQLHQYRELVDHLTHDKQRLMKEVVRLHERQDIQHSEFQSEMQRQSQLITKLTRDNTNILNDVAKLQNELDKVLSMNSELQHRLRLDQLEMKLLQTVHTEPDRLLESGPMGNEERRGYEQKLQSKRALIQLLNRKIGKLEEELSQLTIKCENLQSELVARLGR